ncbi:ABH15 protein, partial [Heliornis fulica]|nr:ABH15 protein [Heliornis fulica]
CRLLCKPSALTQHLARSLGRWATGPGGRWQRRSQLWMLWELLKPPEPEPEVVRELLQLADNGLVALDWLVGQRGTAGGVVGGPGPVLLLVPNATGKVSRGLLQLGLQALERGFVPVIFNRRGHNGCPLGTPRLQPFGDPRDLGEAVTYVRCRHPAAPVLGCWDGTPPPSPPATVEDSRPHLVPWLSQLAPSPATRGVVGGQQHPTAISPPWPPGPIRYTRSLAEVVDVDRLLGSRSLRELEETLFCQTKSHPTTWETYWEHNEPLRDADEVAVPVLCLCHADDPVRGPPARSLPLELFRSSPYFFLLLTPGGGHCGSPPLGSGGCWGHGAVLEYFRAMVEFLRAEEQRKGLPRP